MNHLKQRSTLAPRALSVALVALVAGCGKAHSAPEVSVAASAAAPTIASAASPDSAPTSAHSPEAAPSGASGPSPAAPTPATSTLAAPIASTSSSAGAVAAPPSCPPEMVKVGRACVDMYEAHLVSIGQDGAEVILPHFQRPEKGVSYQARSSAGVFPQGYISRVESAAACKNAGKRLCSRTEWLRACQGPRHRMYPYGARAKSGTCNNGKLHLLPQLFGSNARAWKYDETFNNPLLNQEPGYLAKTGSYPDCASTAGAVDLVGNLHEWVSDMVDEELVAKLDEEKTERRKQPWRTGNGIFMGGFFSTTNELGAGCYYTTIAHEPSYHDYSTGFRCCEDAPRDPAAPSPKKKR